MNPADSLRALSSAALDPDRRPARLSFGPAQRMLERQLVLQHADLHEGFMAGISGRLTCLSPRGDLPAQNLKGLPVSVQITTDRGRLHTINAIITQVRAGQNDGSLSCYQLTIRDALSLMEQGKNRRIFLNKTLPEILQILLGELRQRSAAMARAFEFDLSGLNRERYPARAFVQQAGESTAAFIRRLIRRDGATVFVKAGRAKKADDPRPGASPDDQMPVHTLVFCDDPMRLPQGATGTVRYHPRDAGTEARDAVTLFSTLHSLTAGRVDLQSWDYKPARMGETQYATNVDQGETGNDLARLLADYVIDVPHAGDSQADFDRIGRDRMLAHEAQAEVVDGVSGVRDLMVGTWFELAHHPEVDQRAADQRQFVTTSLHHDIWNNLPTDLHDQAVSLFDASRPLFKLPTSLPTAGDPSDQADRRYTNTFSCVRRGVPLTPAYDPGLDLPRVHPITAIVVAPKGEEVFIDSQGRVYVQIQGLNPADHAHAQGAGTNGTPTDSAPVRVACALAGENFGVNIPLRAGMEVILDHLNGDPDRLVITGVLPNGRNPPAKFNHISSLPRHSFVSGIKTKEFKGDRYNQLRFIDTPQKISSQLASQHAQSELNLGQLTRLQTDGAGEDRGEGAELRSDANVAIRSGRAMLISAWQRLNATDGQLARDETLNLMQECVDLFKNLGDYAAQHQGVAMDTQPHAELVSTVKSWPNGTGGASSDASQGASQAAIGITAPAGVSVATPKTVATVAGGNIDTVAQNHVQQTAGQRINLQAGKGVALFTQGGDISAIANQGKVRLQSQADDTQIDSAKNIRMTAASGKLAGMASDEVVFVTSGGAYLKLKGADIELGCPGKFIVKSAGHTWAGPASMSTDMPTFDHAPLGRVPQLVRASDGGAVEGFKGEVHKASGDILAGQTDSSGTMQAISHDQFEQVVVKFFKPD